MNEIDPAKYMMEYELNHLFLSYCSFIALINTKKLNLANVFLFTLKDTKMRDLCKQYCIIKNDHALVKTFLQFDPNLYKSKYITKYATSLKESNAAARTKNIQLPPKVKQTARTVSTPKKLRRPVRRKKGLARKA